MATINGTNGNDTLAGTSGDDIINPLLGFDMVDGGAGTDRLNVDYTGQSGADSFTSTITASGTSYSGVFSSSNLANSVQFTGIEKIGYKGDDGNDTVILTASPLVQDGRATLDGGSGSDNIVLDLAAFSTSVTFTGNTLSIMGSTLASFANFETYSISLGDGADSVAGGQGKDTIFGGSGNDTIGGNTGADELHGGDGDDLYIVNGTTDVVIESDGDGGDDTVRSSVSSFTLSANVENLVLTGTTGINGLGNALANHLTGNNVANVLNGREGADTMIGGDGNDTFIVDDAGDVVIEAPNQGNGDAVKASISYTLGADVEQLTLTGSAAINGTGNASANGILGSEGENILDGGAGADTMLGGYSDDIFIVDNPGDRVVEYTSQGTDTVKASVSFTLTANFEKLVLTGTADIEGAGNTLANHLTGNDGDNILDGGVGADTISGGNGDDIHIVDNVGDMVVESANQGNDTVKASISYTLGTNVEKLFLTGTADINGTGNALANYIAGNSGANSLSGGANTDFLDGKDGNDTLDGGAEADKLQGGNGDDLYIVDNAGDTVTEYVSNGLGGIDSVRSSVSYTLSANVENLTLTGTGVNSGDGNASANSLTGNAGANRLSGGANADTIDGGAGADSLTGGTGKDVFLFQAGQANDDMVTDFQGNGAAAGDTLVFHGYGAGAVATVGSGMITVNYSGGSDVIHLDTVGLDISDYSFT